MGALAHVDAESSSKKGVVSGQTRASTEISFHGINYYVEKKTGTKKAKSKEERQVLFDMTGCYGSMEHGEMVSRR